MTIITKNGDPTKAIKSLKEFTCCDCGCKFKTNEYSIDARCHSRIIRYSLNCPCCNAHLAPEKGYENIDEN